MWPFNRESERDFMIRMSSEQVERNKLVKKARLEGTLDMNKLIDIYYPKKEK